MTKIAQITVSKALVAFVAAAMLFTMFATPAKAATTVEDLQAMMNTVMAQIAALQGNTNISGGNCAAIPAPLTIGAQNSYVTNLQNYLLAAGQSIPAGATGYFGTQTQAALAAWQAANGVAPAVGYYGPITAAAMAAKCVPVDSDDDNNDDDDTTSGDLEGGAGSIEDADWISGLTGEEVGEGADDVKVAGLDIDADDGSDIRLTAVRLDFTFGTADQDFEDYADEVSLWFDGEEVARADADEFTDENNYSKTLSLDEDAIIRAGDTGQLIVAVSAVGNLDTNDVTDTWTVEFESIRFEDAQGAIITDNATGDIEGVTRTFSFESFATANDTEFKIALQTGSAADAINKAHLIDAHATDGTDNVRLLAFTLEAEGDSDLEIREFLVDLVVTGATDVDDMVQGGASPAARLIIDGEEYGTASYVLGTAVVGAAEEVFFDDVNYTLAAGETVDAYIEVDLNDTTGAAVSDDMDEGDTILAQITATQHAALTDIDVRDETGTQVALADISGTAVGEASRVYDVIFTLETDGWTNGGVIAGGASGIDDQVNFNLSFTVTAVGGDLWIDDACTEDADGTMVEATNDGLGFNFFQSAGTLASVALTCSFTTTGATPGTGNWLVTDGTTETFNVAINAVADVGSSFVQVSWEGLGWSNADGEADRLFEGSLDDTYKSESIFLKMN